MALPQHSLLNARDGDKLIVLLLRLDVLVLVGPKTLWKGFGVHCYLRKKP